MIYDGDCNFCVIWVHRWQRITGESVEYLPFQDTRVVAQFPELPRERLATAVHLLEPDGSVFSGAEAAFRTLAHNPREHWLLDWYEHSPVFARVSESSYCFVARHRTLFAALTRMAWGTHLEPATHNVVTSVFLRALGGIYLVAFVSLWTQILGLVGSSGILPAKLTMLSAQQQAAAAHLGWERYHWFPTLCWFGASDGVLQAQCAAGSALALLLVVGIAPGPCLLVLWLLYLSLSTVCREFLGFQWDILLLEAGFLAIFLSPLQLLLRPARAPPPSRILLWLFRWLLFRLMFESGCVKLVSGDPTWRSLTALKFHYETQPLPTWIGWYAHQFPAWFQHASAGLMFGIELVLPFLIFGPRRFRQVPCVAFIVFQLLILLTGNYCFFNLLTMVLCLPLLDDNAVRWLVPARWRSTAASGPGIPAARTRRWSRALIVPLACVTVVLSLMQFSGVFRFRIPWPRPLLAVYEWLAPFRSLNTYGLFAVMTTSRSEISVEGSSDGHTWLAYEFRYKPEDVRRRPRFVEPHQPRLDWQMWFAALSDYRRNPWFINFCLRLLQGSPQTLALLEHNPFPNAPPRYVRAVAYEYHFTSFAERRQGGAWWRRELKGIYLPALSLSEER